MAEDIKPPGGPGGPAPGPVAPEPKPGKLRAFATAATAKLSVPLFGGNRGGKKRQDGLVPGSPEAAEADRKKDAERKRQEREEKRKLVEPAALPSAVESGPGQPGAPLNGQGPGVPDPEPPPIPWDPDMLKEFTDELVDSAEAKRVEKFTAKAKEAGLPEKVVIEVRADSHYGSGKKTVKLALPRVGAKWLTKSGISSEWRDEVQLLSGMAALRFQGSRLERKLDKLIELKKKKEEEIQKSEQEQRVGKILPKQPVTLSAALAARTNQSNENKTESPS